jgi:hypothetical protein
MGDQVTNTVYKDKDVQKYVFIFEDYTVKQATSYEEDDLKSCDAGILQIVRVSDMTTYYEGEWLPLDQVNS